MHKRILHLLIMIVLITFVTGCAGAKVRRHPIVLGLGNECDGVFKLSIRQTQTLIEEVLAARNLDIKDTRVKKEGTEIYASHFGDRISIKLEPIGPSTKVTIWAKKYRLITDTLAAQDLMLDLEKRFYSQVTAASTAFN